jgi:3-isopropylmalate/(R)-2-methylmalate dehydratase small subunit
MTTKTITGKAWVGGDDVYAFDIITQEHWHKAPDPEENSKWVMAGVAPEFEGEGSFKSHGYAFIVAGSNFAGGGKSIEHPITGLMGAGIKAVIAESVSRLQFRNAINRGLPLLTAKGIHQKVKTGDELSIDLESGKISISRTGEEIQGSSIPDFVSEIANAGGLIQYVKQALKEDSFDVNKG